MSTLTDFDWLPSSEDRWQHMLEVLPPCYWVKDLFLVGEAWRHTDEGLPQFETHNKIDGKYVVGSRPITIAEAKQLQSGYDLGFGHYAEAEAQRLGETL